MDQKAYDDGLAAFIAATNKERPEFEGRYYSWPFLNEDTATTGFDVHYIYHVGWALRKLAEHKPAQHVDFSSSLYFCIAASAVCKTTFYDFRPANLHLSDLKCECADLTALPLQTASIASASCMHVIEHIGLGRYGDPIDACGDLRAIAELKRVVGPGGRLYMVAPTGRPSVAFNAHRVYAADALVARFEPEFTLEEFYFIPGQSFEPPILNPLFSETLAYEYGCGCYAFRRFDPVPSDLASQLRRTMG
jgi:SAM-dependent methyltransferase